MARFAMSVDAYAAVIAETRYAEDAAAATLS
jgi:hypothetical protein